MLFLSKHCHHNEGVQVDPFTQHPEVVTAHEIMVDEHGHFTAHLGEKTLICVSASTTMLTFLMHIPGHIVHDTKAHYSICTLTGLACVTSWLFATQVKKMMVITEYSTKEKKRFLCRVILWQLKLLSGKKQQTILDWVKREVRFLWYGDKIFSCDLLKIEKYPQRRKQRHQRQSMTNQNQIVEIKCCLK